MNVSITALDKGEVVADLFAKPVSDLIKVLGFEESHGAPFLDPFLVECMVVKGKDGLDVLPLTLHGDDASSSFFPRAGDEMMDDSKPLGFIQRLARQSVPGFAGGFGSSYTVEPVFDSTQMSSSRFHCG